MNQKYKQNFLQAGEFASKVRAFGKSLIKPGASYNDVIRQINHMIFELGARPAFPPQIALNDTAAHYLPHPGEDIIFSDQVVKLDVGVCYKGAIGDCAVTVDLSGKYQLLIEAAEKALLAAEKSIKVGMLVREIGRVIEDTVVSLGFKPVKNLSGHGLGHYKIHTPPCIPNYLDSSTAVVKPGMTFAIEPFVTDGNGAIYEGDFPTIFSFDTFRPLKSARARALLPKIKTFQGLPFAIHDLLSNELSLVDIQHALHELMQARVIYGYGPLYEEGRGMVAQAENSVLVDEQGKVFVTTRTD